MATSSDSEHFNKITFDRIYTFRVGSIPVVFGLITSSERSGPSVFAAALSERDLRHESCGYGVTEAEAAADLFRFMR